jgi:hypothetical protein
LKKRLEEIDIHKKELESERKKLEGQMGWNTTKIIQYLEDNNLKKILFDKYSFLVKKLPSRVSKLLKNIDDFPDKYKTPQKINKTALLIDYQRKKDLKDLVEITTGKKIFIKETENATVNYTKQKGIKRLSKERN